LQSGLANQGGFSVNKFKIGFLAGMVALGLAASSGAQEAKQEAKQDAKQDARNDVSARILKTLQTRIPKITIEKVQPSQWPWLYEVITDGELFYTDETGNYLFYGKVMDTRTREDLTSKRWNALTAVDFNSLPLNLALKQVKGDGSRKVAVFADPDCPFCVRFEHTLQDVTNVTVYTFLFPLDSLHPNAMEKSKRIWCSKDRQSTWAAWMLNKKELPTTSNCNTDGLNTLVKLGEKMKVSGTPTLIFEDGHRVPGALDKEQLEEEFANAVPKPKG
jgi:thiol:disulfide interchange protein DsbC